jgi:hypothetical protein
VRSFPHTNRPRTTRCRFPLWCLRHFSPSLRDADTDRHPVKTCYYIFNVRWGGKQRKEGDQTMTTCRTAAVSQAPPGTIPAGASLRLPRQSTLAPFVFSYISSTPHHSIGIPGYNLSPHLRNFPFYPNIGHRSLPAAPVRRTRDAFCPSSCVAGLKHHLSALFPSLYRQNRGSWNAAAHHIHNIRVQKLCEVYYPSKEGCLVLIFKVHFIKVITTLRLIIDGRGYRIRR